MCLCRFTRWKHFLYIVVVLLSFVHCRRTSSSATSTRTAKRIVSISASTTEALFAIGAGPQLVGRSRYCNYPPEVFKLPIVGGFVDPNIEAILALKPDFVVGARGPLGPGIERTLHEHGIATLFPPTESLTEIIAMLEELGHHTGHEEQARQVTQSMRSRIGILRQQLQSQPRPKVLMLFAASPISVAGPNSFANEMIALAGGDNVVHEGPPYPVLSLEKIIHLDPDWIINAEMSESASPLGSSWSTVRAVREGRVKHLNNETLLRPGPRVLEGVTTLIKILHPTVTIH